MKKIVTVLIVILLSSLLSSAALAATIEGSVQGFTCVREGRLCPLDRDDPMINMENVFVVQTVSQGYYFVPNISRDTLASLLNQKCKITGKTSRNHNSIIADALYTWQNGVWNPILNVNDGYDKQRYTEILSLENE